MIVVALAGLPGTGKSTLARALGPALPAPVLDKDTVRAELLAGRVEYTPAQDDEVMETVYARAAALAASGAPAVILDGRTFTRVATVQRLLDFAATLGAPLLLVECVCDEAVALDRLARDAAGGASGASGQLAHPAANRGPELYRRLAAAADPIAPPKLVLDTGRLAVDEQVDLVRKAVADLGPA